MDDVSAPDLASLVQDFLSAASAPEVTAPDGPVVAELAYGLDQAVSAFLDQHGLAVDAYSGVEQHVLEAIAHDLHDQAGVNPNDLLDASHNGYDTHAVLDAFSQHWPDAGADGYHDVAHYDAGSIGHG